MIRLLATLLLALLLVPAVQAGGKKPSGLQVSFHLQGDPSEGPKFVFPQATAGQEIHYRVSAEFTQKDFVAFSSFPADDKRTYGVMLQLNKQASQRLLSMSAAHRGQYLLAIVNGNVRDAVLIDRAVNDGVLVIWQRVTLPEVREAAATMPHIGQDPAEWKEEQKKK